MLRALPYAVALAIMLGLTIIGFAIIWLAWGNNSCGWEDGNFGCPMTHVIRDLVGWIIAFLGLLAARNVVREAWNSLPREDRRQDVSSSGQSSDR